MRGQRRAGARAGGSAAGRICREAHAYATPLAAAVGRTETRAVRGGHPTLGAGGRARLQPVGERRPLGGVGSGQRRRCGHRDNPATTTAVIASLNALAVAPRKSRRAQRNPRATSVAVGGGASRSVLALSASVSRSWVSVGPSIERLVEGVNRIVVQDPWDDRLAVRAAQPGEPEHSGELLPVDRITQRSVARGRQTVGDWGV
jgi:hypothetical protein